MTGEVLSLPTPSFIGFLKSEVWAVTSQFSLVEWLHAYTSVYLSVTTITPLLKTIAMANFTRRLNISSMLHGLVGHGYMSDVSLSNMAILWKLSMTLSRNEVTEFPCPCLCQNFDMLVKMKWRMLAFAFLSSLCDNQ